MKNKIFIVSLIMSLFLIGCNDNENEPEKEVSYDELPTEAKNFISTYFYGHSVDRVEKETVNDIDLYEVTLEDGFELEFNGEGEWLQVVAPENSSIPDIGFVPLVIRQTLNNSYHGYGVKQVNKEGEGYKIQLVSGDNFYFNMSGEIVPDPNL